MQLSVFRNDFVDRNQSPKEALVGLFFFQLLMHLAPQRITWLVFKKNIILQEKTQGRDLGLNACLLLCGG